MNRLRSILTGSLLTLALSLTILATVLVLSDIQSVQADVSVEPVVATIQEETRYLPLQDAPPQRDITRQQFAPSQ